MPKRFLLLAVTFSLSVLLYVDRVCISTAKDSITHDLQLTDKQFGWILSAFALGYALFQMPCGALADRLGPRRVLALVVLAWSVFTGLTGAVSRFGSLFVVRFCFGAGEAGAFPGLARAVYSWMPMNERGIAQGINFSGSRLGAAFGLPLIAGMIESLGWRQSFTMLMLVGFVWAVFWYLWFRDDPTEDPSIAAAERAHILATRQQKDTVGDKSVLRIGSLLGSRNMQLAMVQYFCSNFTFFFCLTWFFPYVKRTYDLASVEAGWYASAPLVFGAIGNIVSGWFVDRIYGSGRWKLSRQLPAIVGFSCAAIGLIGCAQAASALSAVSWLSLAIFGADMTLSPSWSFCIDIGRSNAGAVSGTMNMAGNIGSFVTSLAFPYLLAWTGSPRVFFYIGAALNLLAIGMWWLMQPDRPIEQDRSSAREQPSK